MSESEAIQPRQANDAQDSSGPPAKIFGRAMEDLSLRVEEHTGLFIRVLGGNSLELISRIIAIIQCQLEVLQASLVGSILINILLVMGWASIFAASFERYVCQVVVLDPEHDNPRYRWLCYSVISFSASTNSGDAVPTVKYAPRKPSPRQDIERTGSLSRLSGHFASCFSQFSHSTWFRKNSGDAAPTAPREPPPGQDIEGRPLSEGEEEDEEDEKDPTKLLQFRSAQLRDGS
ncbi:hypothetical protein FB45DRAFT_1019037 [Roridomyces roridus]|uniref:Sodium/calcium exchanger membrane region domain-containing protein n=1 Tax=Roridomyces roridus TaxID=1738132 RepID=A0AAD7CE17_9AGAR|nr:hypothetical protein FB45DRAFT_1019037 [Roridomyces roridus]